MTAYKFKGWSVEAASAAAHYWLRGLSQEWMMVEPPYVGQPHVGWLRDLAQRGERAAPQALAAVEGGTHVLRGMYVKVERSRQDSDRRYVHKSTQTVAFLWVEAADSSLATA